MTERKIIWLKWIDPLAGMVFHRPDEEEPELEDVEAEASRSSFVRDTEVMYDKPHVGGVGPTLVGPMGVIPVHEGNYPSKLFNFWMGHANFDLSGPLIKTISRVPGVETLDIFTRYRFRIGIGRAFSGPQVRKNIDQAIQMPAKIMAPVEEKPGVVKTMLSRRFRFWAIYKMPDGKWEAVGGESPEEVTAKGQKFANAATEVEKSW